MNCKGKEKGLPFEKTFLNNLGIHINAAPAGRAHNSKYFESFSQKVLSALHLIPYA